MQKRVASPRGLYLSIGVDWPSASHYGQDIDCLLGSHQDAAAMSELARSQGLKPVKANEHELIGDAALYATVKRRIVSASRRLHPGDLFLITFSGHGNSYDWGHLPVLQPRNEPSTETWCLYDNELFDLELGALWTKFAEGVRIVVVSDSCASGTVSNVPPFRLDLDAILATERALYAEVLKTRRRKRLSRATRSDTLCNVAEQYNRRLSRVIRREVAEQRTVARVLLLAACEESGQAADADEIGSSPFALFTEKLCEVWKADKRVSYRNLIEQTAVLVEKVCPEQHPVPYKTPTSQPSFDHSTAFQV